MTNRYVQPARCLSTSAAFSFFLNFISSVTGFQKTFQAFPGHCSGCFLVGGSSIDGLIQTHFRLFHRSVHDAARFSASAAPDCFLHLFSATGTGFTRSTAGGGRPAGDGKSAGPDQAGNTHAGEQILQILSLHGTLLGVRSNDSNW